MVNRAFHSINPRIPQMRHSSEPQARRNFLTHHQAVIKLSLRCKSTRKFYFSITKMESFFFIISLRAVDDFPRTTPKERDEGRKWEYFLAMRKLYILRKIYVALSRRTYMEMSIINPAEKNEKLLPRSYAVNYLKAHSLELSSIRVRSLSTGARYRRSQSLGASDEKRLRHTSNINYQF
jgi:hypothetical protein